MEIKQIALEVGQLIEIEVEALNYSSHAVGRLDGIVVLVSGGVPGDRLLARITEVKRNYAMAEAVDVVSASPHRCEPPCVHFIEGCGGCQWQHITYEHQFQWKKEIVRQALRRIGKLDDIPEVEARGPGPSLHYRNKLTLFPARDRGTLGMQKLNSHDVVPIRECLISNPLINSFISALSRDALPIGDGLDRVGIRCSVKNQQTMLVYIYPQGEPEVAIQAFGKGLSEIFAQAFFQKACDTDELSRISGLTSLFTCVGTADRRFGRFIRKYGEPTIQEEVRGIRYRIGPGDFFQVNISGLEELVRLVREFAGENSDLVVDAHCGVGTFTLQAADISAAVLGVDISPASIASAKSNAEDNGIKNAFFRNGRVSQVLGEELCHAGVDLVILDPPRKGCEKSDLRGLIKAQPGKVIYISCNPTTLARDLRELANAGYRLLRLAMVDMFPMTYHVETVALLGASRVLGESGGRPPPACARQSE